MKVLDNKNIHMQEKKGGKFFNGFFWGAALGGGAAYVLSTKKGRDTVKELISQGIDMLEDAVASKVAKVEEMVSPVLDVEEEVIKKEPIPASPEPAEKADPTKRFFKKAAKK